MIHRIVIVDWDQKKFNLCGVSELKIWLIEMRNDRGEDAIDCVKDIREGTFLMLTLIAWASVHLWLYPEILPEILTEIIQVAGLT